jgi:ankyrin repeat protein
MPTPTEQLQSLRNDFFFGKCSLEDFKQSAMSLAEEGADITVPSTCDGSTLLHVLVRTNQSGKNNNDIAKLVEKNPAVLKSKDRDDQTALQSLIGDFYLRRCSLEDFKQSAMFLAEAGADITVRSTYEDGSTLLHVLVRTNQSGKNNNDIAKLVEKNPAVLESKDGYDQTALQSLIGDFYFRRCSLENFKQSAMFLAEAGADITVRSTSGDSTLLDVLVRTNESGKNNNDIAKLVEKNPAVLESKDENNRTILQSLIDDFYFRRCSFEAFKQSAMLLAELGANLSLGGTTGSHNTLLHTLILREHAQENDAEIQKLIARNPEVVNFTNGRGDTPLSLLLYQNESSDVRSNIVQTLLSEKNLRLVNDQGATLLHAACYSGNLSTVEYLNAKGLELTALTKENRTLIHYAAISGNKDLVEWLIKTKQIDINKRDNDGVTALHAAITVKNTDPEKIRDLVKLLVLNGADITIQDKDGKNALKLAIENKYSDLIPYLFDPNELKQKIQAMHNYGTSLQEQGASKGKVVIDLADALTTMTTQFFAKELKERDFDKFKEEFSALLHSKNQEMKAYRVSWSTIVKNIAIALTGVGLCLIVRNLLDSKAEGGRMLFFSQKSKTTSEEKIADIEQSLNCKA